MKQKLHNILLFINEKNQIKGRALNEISYLKMTAVNVCILSDKRGLEALYKDLLIKIMTAPDISINLLCILLLSILNATVPLSRDYVPTTLISSSYLIILDLKVIVSKSLCPDDSCRYCQSLLYKNTSFW